MEEYKKIADELRGLAKFTHCCHIGNSCAECTVNDECIFVTNEKLEEILVRASDAIDRLCCDFENATLDLKQDLAYKSALADLWESFAIDCKNRLEKLINASPESWVSVDDRLPDKGLLSVRVLCCLVPKKKKRMDQFSWIDIRYFNGKKFVHPKGQKGKVTHWMYLPDPPEQNTTYSLYESLKTSLEQAIDGDTRSETMYYPQVDGITPTVIKPKG